MTVRALGAFLTLTLVCLACVADTPHTLDRQNVGSSSDTTTSEKTPFAPNEASEKSPYGLLLAFVILTVAVLSVIRLASRAQLHGYGDGRGIDTVGATRSADSGSGGGSGGGGFGGGHSSGGGASGEW